MPQDFKFTNLKFFIADTNQVFWETSTSLQPGKPNFSGLPLISLWILYKLKLIGGTHPE